MKNLIYAEDSPKRFKVGDNDTNITIVPIEITDSVNTLVKMDKNANARVLIRNKNTYITSITPVITDSVAVISSKKLVKMPAGEYFLELWVTTDSGTVVYPDRGFLPLFINENAEGETGDPITNVDADDLRDELKQWVTEQLKTIHGSDVDLSNYFTKDEVTKLVDNNKVDLTPYLKTVDADGKYLTKGTIVLDTNGRTLTVGNSTINIPNTVDLSDYAKTDSVPNITYNSGTNTINLNGTDIKLSSDVDLSDYYTKEQVDDVINDHKVDLTPYLKTADADGKYLIKGTIVLDTNGRTLTVGNNTINIPNTVDLSEYAKADTVPNITYNNGTNTINLNGTDIKLSSNVDLSDYYTKEQVDEAINDHKVDLTPYLKTVDGDNKYLVKGTIVLDTNGRTLTVGNNTINIPNTVDLSEYAKADTVPNITYNNGTNTINLNGTDIKLSSNVDLSDYYTKEQVDEAINDHKVDLTPYLKTVDGDNKYLPKGTIVLDTNGRTLTVGDNTITIPNTVDFSEYAKADTVPNITYNNGTNTINLNGTDIKLSSNVDLSDYYTKGEIDSKLSNSSANVNLDNITNKLGITQFNTNFSPTLDNGSIATNLNVYAGYIDLSTSSSKYEYLTLVKNGTTDVNPDPTADDLDNAQDITDLTGVTLLNGYRWFTILSGRGFRDTHDFAFGSAWFFNSLLPYLSIRVIAYDTANKKYVAVNKAGAGEPLVRLLPLTSQTSEGDFNSGTKVRMYAEKDNNWLVKDLVYKSYKNNSNLTDKLVGLPFYQVINILTTGVPDPQGSTRLVTFNGEASNNDQIENNAPVTFFLTNLGGGEMKLGDQSLNPSTALVYQYPDKNTGQYELPIKLSSDSKSWLISCYKGRHLVPFLKQVDSDGQLRPINNSADAFEPVYNGGPTNTQKEVTLYPFGIEPVHITFTN